MNARYENGRNRARDQSATTGFQSPTSPANIFNKIASNGSRISPRELQVLSWISKGKSNIDIAVILDMSARTVEKHLEHIYQKLGVENRVAAALWVLGTRVTKNNR